MQKPSFQMPNYHTTTSKRGGDQLAAANKTEKERKLIAQAQQLPDDLLPKSLSFRDDSEQTPVPISTTITMNTQQNNQNSTRETPQEMHKKKDSISSSKQSAKIPSGVYSPGGTEDMIEHQSSKSSITQGSGQGYLNSTGKKQSGFLPAAKKAREEDKKSKHGLGLKPKLPGKSTVFPGSSKKK